MSIHLAPRLFPDCKFPDCASYIWVNSVWELTVGKVAIGKKDVAPTFYTVLILFQSVLTPNSFRMAGSHDIMFLEVAGTELRTSQK